MKKNLLWKVIWNFYKAKNSWDQNVKIVVKHMYLQENYA